MPATIRASKPSGIIEGYRAKIDDIREERYDTGLRFINTPWERYI
jgi:hypothetical protein